MSVASKVRAHDAQFRAREPGGHAPPGGVGAGVTSAADCQRMSSTRRSNALRLEEYIDDAERDGDNELVEFSARPKPTAARVPSRQRPCRRGGLRSHRGAGGPTKKQLYADAKRHWVKGRSKMTKSELAEAVDR